MHDPNLRKRNALVIPGALLAFYALLAIVYYEGLRTDDVPCGDGGLVRGSEVCYNAWKPLVLTFLFGSGLVLTGLLVWRPVRGTPEALTRPGTGTHTVFALLASLVVTPLFLLLGVVIAEGSATTEYVIEVGATTYSLARGLGALTLVALVPFAAFAGLLALQARNRRRLERLALERSIRPVEMGHSPSLRAAPVRDVRGAPAVYIVDGDDKGVQ